MAPDEKGGDAKDKREAPPPARDGGKEGGGERGKSARSPRPSKRAPAKAAPADHTAAKPIMRRAGQPTRTREPLLPQIPHGDLARLLGGEHAQPHNLLGAHPARVGGQDGAVVRAIVPNAIGADCVLENGTSVPLALEGSGQVNLFGAFLPGVAVPLRYRLRFRFADGAVWEREDPYRFLPTIGDVDLHLFNEGTHRKLWEMLGAHVRTVDGVQGVGFAVWAPNARRVSVVGDFSGWDGRLYPMRTMGSSGVFELFLPEVKPGALYKYELMTREGMIRVKTDPYAFKLEQPPGSASIIQSEDTYTWHDDDWMERRARHTRDDILREPILIYEAHLGSWARTPEEGNRILTYSEIAPKLATYVRDLGFTHVELLPVMEHPFYGSWGYLVSGYYAPTSRYGTPDEFRFLVDTLHQYGIGVILDWVPAHFPKDDFALRRFDGTALYEHEDPRLGEHPDWGTLVFNYGRNEVRNFLVANALYWLDEFHADGLRVDAVASMLYLDYSRSEGEWLRNRYGGRENIDAIDFLRQFNEVIRIEKPGCITVAEESTAWPGVTQPASEGGLGFTFKWNMGWMHDTLLYFAKEPVYRKHHHDQLTFAMIYEYTEHFIMPLSHDEVVHQKGSLLNKMPGDEWQKFANLRLLLAYMFTRPGKKLLFMGTELASYAEWNHESSLDWHLLSDDPRRAALHEFVRALAKMYREHSPFWRQDPNWEGFTWIDIAHRDESIVSYARRDGAQHAVIVLNMTPVPRDDYRIGVPGAPAYAKALSSDDVRWGGSGYGAVDRVGVEQVPYHGYQQSIVLTLPPLGAVVLLPE